MGAPFACSKKDVQSVERESCCIKGKGDGEREREKAREKEGRVGASEANERHEGEKGGICMARYRYGTERGTQEGDRERGIYT